MRIMHPTVWKVLIAGWEAAFGEPLSNQSLERKTPQGRTRFLTKSGIGASRIATSSAQQARAGQRLRRTRAKAAKPLPEIGAHFPVESSARKLLLVALGRSPATPFRCQR